MGVKCTSSSCSVQDVGTDWSYFTPIVKDNPQIYCIRCDGKVVGVTEMICSDNGCQIGFTEVKKQHRRKGVGKALIKYALKQGRGPFTISAEEDAVEFWKSFDFKPIDKELGLTIMVK